MDNNTKPVNSLKKTDYLLATSCGLLAGIIDVIFVGDPKNSILGKADRGRGVKETVLE